MALASALAMCLSGWREARSPNAKMPGTLVSMPASVSTRPRASTSMPAAATFRRSELGAPAAGEQHGIDGNRARLAGYVEVRGNGIVVRADTANAGVQQDVEALPIDLRERPRYVVVLPFNERPAVVGERDVGSQRTEEVRHFHADVPAADDQQRARLRLQPHDGVGGVVHNALQPRNVRHQRSRAGAENDAIRRHAVHARFQDVRRHEARRGVVHRHVRLRPAVLRPRFGNRIDLLPYPSHQPLPIHTRQGMMHA